MTLFLLTLLAAAPAASWPTDLTTGWTALSIKRTVPGQSVRSTRLALGPDGVWKTLSPWRGEADLQAVARLKVALEAPLLLELEVKPAAVSSEIELRQGARVRRVVTQLAALNQPIRISVDGKQFVASPVELSIKLPHPDDFAPPGLWVGARDEAISIEVKGRVHYTLVGQGEDWKAADGGIPDRGLDDVVGVIVGRQAAGHPRGASLAALGLQSPAATARLCTAKLCREFKFGTANGHYYAVGPDSDPLELRDNDWKLLVDGPFPSRPAPR